MDESAFDRLDVLFRVSWSWVDLVVDAAAAAAVVVVVALRFGAVTRRRKIVRTGRRPSR